MAARTPKKPVAVENTTPTPPIAPPPASAESWTMQAVVQLTAATAKLEGAITTLSEKCGDLKDGQDALSQRIEKLERKVIVATTVIAVVIALGSVVFGVAGYVGNKAIDFGLEMAKGKMQEASQVVPPSVPPQQ